MFNCKAPRIIGWTGVLFLASGLFHGGVWWAFGMPSLEGPVSWRKPITFGFSTGVLFLSLAWVLGLLPQTQRLVRQAWLFSALLISEVTLIDIQQWRGVPSHFNDSTPLDAAIFTTMGVLIMSAAVLMGVWTIGLLTHSLPTSRANAFAARAGMVMVNVGNLIGVVMAVSELIALKPFHGIALHAIQVLPITVWLGSRLRYPRAWRDALRSARWRSSLHWRHQ